MNNFLGSVGSYFISNRANQELNSLNDDVDSVGTAVGNFFSRMKGKTMKSLPDLLQEYDLPRGLFPKNVLKYEYDETTGALVVYLPFPCEVGYRDKSVLRFNKRVTANMRPGSISEIDGIKTQFIFWMKVTAISAEDAASNKLYFQTSIIKTRPFDVHNFLRDGFEVDSY